MVWVEKPQAALAICMCACGCDVCVDVSLVSLIFWVCFGSAPKCRGRYRCLLQVGAWSCSLSRRFGRRTHGWVQRSIEFVPQTALNDPCVALTPEQEHTGSKKSEPPMGWESKACAVCGALTTEPSRLDISERRTHRKWGLKQFWGDVCWWCQRAQSIRYAHLSTAGFLKYIRESEENYHESAINSFAYMSLREEGRTQVSIEALLARVELFGRVASKLPTMSASVHFEVALLEAFCQQHPGINPISRGHEVIQLRLDGCARLGVRYAAPQEQSRQPASRPDLTQIAISPAVQSSCASDWALLSRLAAEAGEAKRPAEFVSPAPKSRKARCVGSVGKGTGPRFFFGGGQASVAPIELCTRRPWCAAKAVCCLPCLLSARRPRVGY